VCILNGLYDPSPLNSYCVQDGVLHGPRGRQLALPDSPGPAGQEIRHLLLRNREAGGRHRDPHRQVEERQVGADAGEP